MFPRQAEKRKKISVWRQRGRMARAGTIYNYVFIYFIASLNAFRKDKTNNISSVRQEEIKRHYVTLLSGSRLLELKLFANCHRCHDCHTANAHLRMLYIEKSRREIKSNKTTALTARSPDRTKASRRLRPFFLHHGIYTMSFNVSVCCAFDMTPHNVDYARNLNGVCYAFSFQLSTFSEVLKWPLLPLQLAFCVVLPCIALVPLERSFISSLLSTHSSERG